MLTKVIFSQLAKEQAGKLEESLPFESWEKVGGPTWTVKLGRRYSRTASLSQAEVDLPSFKETAQGLIDIFSRKNLNARDMVALSGAHTLGQAQCQFFRDKVYTNKSHINVGFASMRRRGCPSNNGNTNLAPLDLVTPNSFDNNYFKNLQQKKGLFESDKTLYDNGPTDSTMAEYSRSAADFVAAMEFNSKGE
ncbi:hypothetical protein QQ045_024611 [Rhodiola kirilowii]